MVAAHLADLAKLVLVAYIINPFTDFLGDTVFVEEV
jgi:hypothetical protein